MLLKSITIFVVSFLLNTQFAYAQKDFDAIKSIEDSLVRTLDTMYDTKIPEETPIYNEKIIKQLVRALKITGSYNYPFDSLSKRIKVVYADDRSFRIFNWVISPEENTRRYYAAIQMNSEELKLYPLFDCSFDLGKTAEDTVLSKGKWFGALYYRILSREVEGQKIYTLFGGNASNRLTNKKLMDPMMITDSGVVFGAAIFNIRSQNKPTERIKRYIIEYKKLVNVSMDWDADLNAVTMDRLESEVGDPNRKYTFVPTGQYDGFRWSEGYWNYVKDIIILDPLTDGKAPTPQPYKGRD